MPQTPPNLLAGGTIAPHRFVMLDTSNDRYALQATANAKIIGICAGQTNQAPLSDLVTTANHATSGQQVRLYGEGDETLLEAGGTITTGDRLKADSDGKGVAIATTGTAIQYIGAHALEDASSGELTPVQISIYSERPALA